MTSQRCPWVPSGGTPQAGQSGVPPPAIEAKLPWTSRVLPNPTIGEPCAVLSTVWAKSWARLSLLCAVSRRSVAVPASGLMAKATDPMVTAQTSATTMRSRCLRCPRISRYPMRMTSPNPSDAHNPRFMEYTIGGTARTSTTGPTNLRHPASAVNHPRTKKGRYIDKLLPQLLAKAKGAIGRYSSRPRNVVRLAAAGWTIEFTKPLELSDRGRIISTSDVTSNLGRIIPSSPPATVTTNIQPIRRTTLVSETSRFLELMIQSKTTVQLRYQDSR